MIAARTEGRPIILTQIPSKGCKIEQELAVQRAIEDKLGEFLEMNTSDGSDTFSSKREPTSSLKVTLSELLEAGGPAGLFSSGRFDRLLSDDEKRQVKAAGAAARITPPEGGCLPQFELPEPDRTAKRTDGCFPVGSGSGAVLLRLNRITQRLNA